jgi:peptide/nickel transport system substrate-binding protein
MNITRRAILAGTAGAAFATTFGVTGNSHAAGEKVLVVACQNDIPNFDPHTTSDDPSTLLLRNTYDSLTTVVGDPPEAKPGLATAWTVSADGRTYEFKLNPAAKFHDGSPVTSEDVRYSFARLIRLNQGNAWMVAGVVDPDKIEAVNPNTVRFVLKSVFAPFLSVLANLRIVNAKLVEANKGSDDSQTYLRTNIAGSGPFQLQRAEPGNLFHLARVQNDWHEKGGNLSAAIIRIVRESSRQRLMLQSGDVHAAINLSSEDLDQLAGRRGVVTVRQFEFKNFTWKLNYKHGPFANRDLRLAVNYCVDYDALLAVSGGGKRTQGPLYDGLVGFDPQVPVFKTDLQKAKEHLAKSGFTGKSLVATHIAGHEQQRRWTLVLLDSLAKLGIGLDVKPVAWPDMVASSRKPETCPDFFPVFSAAYYADPDNAAYIYHSSRNGSFANPTYGNPDTDKLIDAARAEVEATKRAELYKKFQSKIVEDVPDILAVIPVRPLGFASSVSGFVFTPIKAATIDFLPLSLS